MQKTAVRRFVIAGMVVGVLGIGCMGASAFADDTQASEFSMDLDCLACHQPEAGSAENADTLLGYHGELGQSIDCVVCHDDEKGLAKAHEKMDSGRTAKRLRHSDMTNDGCVSCHNQDDLAEATEGCTVLTDINGAVANPHDLPENDDHATILCVDCHEVHVDAAVPAEEDEETEDTVDGAAAGDVFLSSADALAQETCLSCHHAEVYECGTCHE